MSYENGELYLLSVNFAAVIEPSSFVFGIVKIY